MGDENKKIRLRLNSPKDIRKTLAKITNMIVNNEIDSKKANTIIYSEKKIQELESYINDDK